jgi:4-hydroxybenzoate polyprenyltransferase
MVILWNKALLYLRMIKIAHSVFALPFAFTGAVLAASGLPSLPQLLLIVAAMIGARSGAMGMNRIADRTIDAENPRTKNREIPAGTITVPQAAVFTVFSFGLLVAAAAMLNPLCLKLSPLAIAIVIGYSYTKRFTWLSHFVLGLALAGAPLGAWIAIRGTLDPAILPLGLAVIFWLAGFDVLYALQDIDFDRRFGLYSIPQRFGVRKALMLARLFHAVTCLCLTATGLLFDLGAVYWIGMLVVAGLFVYEHSLVKPDDRSKLDVAFFNMNGYISITVLFFTTAAIVLG